jgi:copper chaperone CopZ
MKRILIIVVLLLAQGGALRAEEPDVVSPAQPDASTVVLTVYGLSCPLCSNNLTGQLKRIPGVEEVEIDLNTGAVSVRLAEGQSVSRWQWLNAVEQAGFTLKDVRPAASP